MQDYAKKKSVESVIFVWSLKEREHVLSSAFHHLFQSTRVTVVTTRMQISVVLSKTRRTRSLTPTKKRLCIHKCASPVRLNLSSKLQLLFLLQLQLLFLLPSLLQLQLLLLLPSLLQLQLLLLLPSLLQLQLLLLLPSLLQLLLQLWRCERIPAAHRALLLTLHYYNKLWGRSTTRTR